MINSDLIDLSELAQILRISTRKIRRLMVTDELPYVRLGDRGMLFRVDSVEAWIKGQEVTGSRTIANLRAKAPAARKKRGRPAGAGGSVNQNRKSAGKHDRNKK